MRFEKTGRVLKLFLILICLSVLACCALEDFVPKWDYGSSWVSKEGKSRDELYQDQLECRRNVTMTHPADVQGPGSGGTYGSGWDLSDIKEFDSCMRSRGWIKE